MEITPEAPDACFAAQIQSASIDLRLSRVFWRPLRHFTIDLRRPKLLEIEPRRYYRKTVLKDGESIVLRPNSLLLGRTMEEFKVPNGYAGELTGRSSFARMGLMVNATGGFINPGWKGHMPLQLVNLGPNSIRLVPGIPLCQLRIVRLTGDAQRPYGHHSLNSLYLNDDGGPSYWWRDKRIQALHAKLSELSVELRIQQDLNAAIGHREPEVVERLEKAIDHLHLSELQDAATILEAFAKREERRRTIRRWAINLSRGLFPVSIGASLWLVNKPPFQWWHYGLWVAAAAAILLSLYAFRTEVGDHFGRAELAKTQGRL
jgi:deoxycytidine triphosphate deaminase